jgi:hypothetical protein
LVVIVHCMKHGLLRQCARAAGVCIRYKLAGGGLHDNCHHGYVRCACGCG